MSRYRLKSAMALTALCLTGLPVQVHAESLHDALTKAYRQNPTLTGARAGQRALDENVPIARANGLPDASVQSDISQQVHSDIPAILRNPARSWTTQATVSVPLYSGGAVRNAVAAAKLRVESGQNDLRGTESSVFARVVAAYLDVIRDSAIVTLNTQNVKSLEVNLRASRDRFEVGDLTRTDVAQSESRLSLARADLQTAQARLISSKETYTALVGNPPENLEAPPPLPGLPDSSETAVAIALNDNPDIKASGKAREAARYDTKATKAQVMPRVSAFASGNYQDFANSQDPGFPYGSAKTAAVGARMTLPIFQGGEPAARERQAAAREAAAIEQSIEVERGVIAQVRAAYASWQASLQAINSTQDAVKAAELSLEGVKAENSVGTRTILDILNAEQEALNARVQLVSARRNAYVAAFSLLAAMGHAEARDLAVDPENQYDAGANYRRVRGKLFDFDFDPAPKPVSGSTRETRAQDATAIAVPGY